MPLKQQNYSVHFSVAALWQGKESNTRLEYLVLILTPTKVLFGYPVNSVGHKQELQVVNIGVTALVGWLWLSGGAQMWLPLQITGVQGIRCTTPDSWLSLGAALLLYFR
jgi:hypothetical protein